MIRSIRAAAVAAVCLAAVACQQAPAGAQEVEGFSSADRAKVEARVAQLDRSVSSGDLAAAIDVVPPRIFQIIAQRAGATEDELRTAIRQMVATQMQGVTVESYDMDLAAPPTRTPDGKRTYLLIPTTTVMAIPGVGRVRSTTSTLALEDGGEWYLVRIDDANQVAILKELWPEFSPVEFPAGTTEQLP